MTISTRMDDMQPLVDDVKRLLRSGSEADDRHSIKKRTLRASKLVDAEALLKMLHSYLFSEDIFGMAVWKLLQGLYFMRSFEGSAGTIAFAIQGVLPNSNAMHYATILDRHGYLTFQRVDDDQHILDIVLTEKSLAVLESWIEIEEDLLMRAV